ncbi:MAG: C39 family peptidase [Candidatus Buchananbacteria bacterium]|jgi:hypothetical protein
MKKLIHYLLVISAVLILSGCGNQTAVVNVEVIPDAVKSPSASVTPAATTVKKTSTPTAASPVPPAVVVPVKQIAQIPDKFLLNIAFAQQAPFGNWDKVHEETCEEASAIMVDKFLKKQPLSEQIMEDELQKLLKWESDRGYKVDLTAQETVDVLKNYFGVTAHLSTNVTVDQIKYELSQGRPIIIPAAGRALGNPNFTGTGPIYHMLVIKGYNATQFITNDPGTRNGNSYAYSYNVLLNAIHDWNPAYAGNMSDAQMLKGEKVMIVVDN